MIWVSTILAILLVLEILKLAFQWMHALGYADGERDYRMLVEAEMKAEAEAMVRTPVRSIRDQERYERYGKPSLWQWHSARVSVCNKVDDWKHGHIEFDLMLMIIETCLLAGTGVEVG